MIEAILSAVPSLFPILGVLVLGAVPLAVLLARRRGRPVGPAVLLALALAVEVAATVSPTGAGGVGAAGCAVGGGAWTPAVGQQGLMNVALYVPLAFFGVLVLRRPLTVLAGGALLSALTETGQALLPTGRSCDVADLADNVLGTVLGVALACGLQLLRRRTPVTRWRSDLPGAAVLGIGGLGAVLAVFWLTVPLHRDVPGFARMAEPNRQVETGQQTADRLFGPGTLVRLSTIATDAGRSRMEVETDRGGFRLDWPSGRLLAMTAAGGEPAAGDAAGGDVAGAGALTEDQLLGVGGEFVAAWYPEARLTAAEPTGPGGAGRLLDYRRDGGPAPLRVVITVSGSGRILSVSAAPL
ncbi:VanZ family protein [Kitasatospora sp. NPDC096147]|uniref:VanZ family protein n=1 Tax=Kitasatospora sp. NPDC096147 TaxID=3364093 RepID=UPI0037F46CE6